MNIAIVHPYPVHQGAVGGVTRVYELVRHLAQHHRVSVFTHTGTTPAPADSEMARLGVKTYGFALPRPAWRQKTRWWFDATAPYYVHRNVNPALIRALGSADAADPFDVVHLEFGYMAPALAQLGRRAVRSLAEQEVMPLVLERLRRVPWGARSPYERLAVFTRRRAIAFDRRTLPDFDLLYGITPRERDYLAEASGRPAGVLPHVVALNRFTPVRAAEQEAPTILFIGNFAHSPNVHAANWFVTRVWPLVRARVAAVKCEIVGAGMDSSLRGRLSAPGVVLRGYERDLPACYFRATVVVTPVHSGGGMRGKVLEAFAAGCALVSTSIGMDGIIATPGEHCLVGDTPEDMADGVVRYLENPALRRAHGLAARTLVAAHYDAPAVFARLEQDFEQARHASRSVRHATASVEPCRTSA